MRHINPPGLSKPKGYTQVVEVTAGRTIYVSGQVALDAEGNLVGDSHFESQVRQVFENLKTALAAADATLDDVVKITVFLTDCVHLNTFRAVRNAYFTKQPPASSLVQVSQLAVPEWLVEVEAIAVVK